MSAERRIVGYDPEETANVEPMPAPFSTDPRLDESTPERIRRVRKERGLTQAGLAAHIDRSPSWIEKVETGRIVVDKVSALCVLAAALGVSPLALVATRIRDVRRDA